jgi:glycosyltransferase involved in cell wall biosynthesis
MIPFLSIVTRCYKRPIALRRNIISVASQTSRDWEQIFIVDDVGQGLLWANKSLYYNRHRVHGNYVLILDDDDCLAHDKVVANLRDLVQSYIEEPPPDIIMIKMDQILRVLPDELVWGKHPIFGHIGSCCFVVRRDIWNDNIELFGQPNGGDFSFIGALFAQAESGGWRIYWHDEVCTKVQRVGYGKPE